MANFYASYPVLGSGGGGGGGTVTSVGLTAPAFLTVSGSPVTTSGTLSLTLANESANTVFAGPASGGAAAPTFRALVLADMPAGIGTVSSVSVVSANGLAGTVATATTTPAITLSTTITGLLKGNGTAISAAVSNTDYQAPISTFAASANQFVTGFTAPNTFTAAQPSFANLSGSISAAQMLALPSADIYIGNVSNQPVAVAMSGDATLSNTGALTVANLAITNAKIANATIDLTSKVTGVLPVANGGTSASTLTLNNVILGNGTSAVQFVAPGTSGNVLTSNGTTWTSSAAVDTGITQLTGDVTAGPGSGSQAATIANNVVSNGKLSQMPTLTIKGNNTGSTANAIDLTVAQVNTMLGDILANGTVAMSASLNLGTNQIINVVDPTTAQMAATKNYVDSVASGLNPKQAVYAATTGSNIVGTYSNGVAGVGATFTVTATGAFTLDGTTPPVLSRILIKDQTSGFQNGVYDLTVTGGVAVSPVLTRSLDYNTASDMNAGDLIPVINGTVNALTSWLQTATITTVGTDVLVFVEWTANPASYLLKANNLSDVTSASTSYKNISPLTTAGDLVYENATPTPTRLPIGATGNVLTVSGGLPVWVAPATSGTVTSVSVVSANGLAGTVATATTTPAITLSTTITGLLKGNGTAISAASAGTDYQAPISTFAAPANQFVTGFTAPNTFTAAQPSFTNISGSVTAAQMLALANTDIYVGNVSNQPVAVALSGDATITNTGVLTVANLAITNAKIANATIDLTTKVTGVLPVANGGTGDSSLTAYAVLCGGTTSTGAVQSIASVGTTGQVLTSNGAGALPTFQAATGSSSSTVRFVLDGDTIPYTCIDGPHYQQTTQSLTAVFISMLNSGATGSTVIQVNQYRAGALQGSATASLAASGGNPAGASSSLSGTLSLLAGDIITVDVNSVAVGNTAGSPSELAVEY